MFILTLMMFIMSAQAAVLYNGTFITVGFNHHEKTLYHCFSFSVVQRFS